MNTHFQVRAAALRVKVCGMRESGNIAEVAALRPDFMGFIFHPASPRSLAALPEGLGLPDSILKVGVFVDVDPIEIMHTCSKNGLSAVQLHGKESPGQCAVLQGLGLSVLKAFPISETIDLRALDAYSGTCDAFVLDAKGKYAGGNGHKFDWGILDQYAGHTPFLLSGGIQPTDADRILALRHPQLLGIDLNSGFETRPGHKDPAMLHSFLQSLYSHTR